ncbi:MAG: hypothetical protein Q4G19_01165 [Clostridia bacterium]|nr:hypothetical protein [Clostridia bacterium]
MLTAYCKKCAKDVPVGEICPYCGANLGKNPARAAWCTERVPVKDWMCWNDAARVIFPAGAALLLLVLLTELLSGGSGALGRTLNSGLPLTIAVIIASVLLLLLAVLLLQGHDLADHVVDKSGIHIRYYLPDPTPVKLLARMKKPSLAKQAVLSGGTPVLSVGGQELAWKNVARVQLWPEKCLILFYAPKWWMRAAVRCTPETWFDVLTLVQEKLGKKKAVVLPAQLRVSAQNTPRTPRKKPEPVLVPEIEEAIEQITMEEMMGSGPEEPAPDEVFPVNNETDGE